jgi:hypothetical protein
MKAGRLCLVSIAIIALMAMVACGGGDTSGSASPTPGATFEGPVQISGSASSALINLMVSADGASLESVSVTLSDLKTESFSAGSMTKQVGASMPIAKGRFSGSLGGLGDISGSFLTATEASGTITLKVEIPFDGTADLGEFAWTAVAGEPGSSVDELLQELEPPKEVPPSNP